MTTSSSHSFSDNFADPLPLWRRLAIGVCLIVAVVGVIRLATPNANASAKSESPHKLTQPIEAIRLGQRVVSHNPLREETHAASAIEPKTWRAVRLHSFQQGVDYDLAFLRSLSWIEEQGATVGSSINLVMPEIGLDGPAEVIAIDPCPLIDPDDGTGRMVVTGTMAHPAANVLDISISGETKPLGTTDTHPIWSEDRHAFVHAGDLQVGERLQRSDGTITQITRITPHTGPPVMTYNLEVDGEHVYRVGEQALLVHNNSAGGTLGSWMSKMKPGEFPAAEPYGPFPMYGPPPPFIRTGPGRPIGKSGPPNTIYDQVRPDGGRSITYFDQNGRGFSRQDFGQLSPHKSIGFGPDGLALPHEHWTQFGPNGPIGKFYRLLDSNGAPIGPWIPE